MTNPLRNLTDSQIEAVASWATTHRREWPLYGRLYEWATEQGYRIDPDSAGDVDAFRSFRERVASRIVASALEELGVTLDQVETAGVRVMPV